jgi:hypothetical protein
MDLNREGEVGVGIPPTGLQIITQGFGTIDIDTLLSITRQSATGQ